MLERLQKKWNVSALRLALIIAIFAIGGSLTGYAGRKLLVFSGVEKGFLWIILYILLITIIWPFAVLLVSIPFGQFSFFKNYIQRIGKRMMGGKSLVGGRESIVASHEAQSSLMTKNYQLPTNLAIFASGAGSNAQKIIDHFKNHSSIKIGLIVCNRPGAGVLSIAERENIPSLLIEKEKFFRGDGYVPELKEKTIDFIVLAGFLWKIPSALIKAYTGKIVNIHPALLPKYGGKGMYGHFVHEAVIASGDTESGITIHYVDEIYDHGKIIFQDKCEVAPTDTAESLAQKIHELEHKNYPAVIGRLLLK
jgi:formyltetrahydrofolate-dependent phosphoribosylglycinamide formyltransferase